MTKKLSIISLDINKTLPTLISTDVATPPSSWGTTTCNSSQEIDIFLFVKSPLIPRDKFTTNRVCMLSRHALEYIIA